MTHIYTVSVDGDNRPNDQPQLANVKLMFYFALFFDQESSLLHVGLNKGCVLPSLIDDWNDALLVVCTVAAALYCRLREEKTDSETQHVI